MKREKHKIKFGMMTGVMLVLIAFFLQSCVMGELGGGIGGTGITVQGIMTKGSIIVNDITFDASSADIWEDDSSATEEELQDGMKVILKGEINDDGVTGTALIVEARDEVQGRVTDLDTTGNPPSFQILNQLIVVDDLTIFSDFPGDQNNIDDMVNNQFVEVHGLRDEDENIRASRVEFKADEGAADPEDMELKGTVSGLSGSTFFIGLQEIDFFSAVIEPAGATISNGDPVEVEGSSFSADTLIATKVEREDLEDAEFTPDEGEEVEIEGFVTGFTLHPGDFMVDGVSVRTLSSTDFKNGSSLDLADGIKVEVEGYVSEEGILIVEELEFEQARVKINAQATASSLTNVTMDVKVRDLVIQINSLTELGDTLTPPLPTSVFYQIEGFQDSNGDIIAESIEDGEDGENILQALVTAKDDALETVTLLESTWEAVISLSTVIEFEDDDENNIADVDTFLSFVVPGQTVVEVKDIDDDGDWDEAELED